MLNRRAKERFKLLWVIVVAASIVFLFPLYPMLEGWSEYRTFECIKAGMEADDVVGILGKSNDEAIGAYPSSYQWKMWGNMTLLCPPNHSFYGRNLNIFVNFDNERRVIGACAFEVTRPPWSFWKAIRLGL
jgi:hypothetical protein